MLSITVSANADSPSSAIQILDVNLVPRDAVSARNGCWDDAPMNATVSCAPPSPEHGDLTATIELPSAASSDVVIEYESMDLTATAGTDYVALDGTLTIKAGESEGSIDIEFIDDLLEEGNEEFVVAVTAAEGINLKHTHIHVTIIDEESIKVSMANASQTEGHLDGMVVDLSFSETVTWADTFRARTTAGTAGTSDYQDWPEVTSPLIFATPEQPVSGFRFRHPLINDSLDEPNETYTITAWGYDYLGRESNSATMTIIDDDDAPEASIADDSGLEDAVGKLSFDVTLGAASGKEVTLDYATANDTTIANASTLSVGVTETGDMLAVPLQAPGVAEAIEVTFDANATTVTVGTSSAGSFGAGDPEMARSETVGGEFGVRSRGADCWDDPPPDVVVQCHPKSMEGGETRFGIRHTVGGIETPTTIELTYSYSTVARTATEGVDYEAASGTLTMQVGDSKTPFVFIPLLDDALDEPDEIFAVHVLVDSGPLFSGLPGLYMVKTIVDNDDPPSVSVADASGLEDAVGKLSFDVTLDAASAKEITLDYATADDTATAASDYTQTNGTLTFSAGETTKTIDVPVLEDGSPEEDETFTVTLSNAFNVTIGDGTGTGTIQDDDPVPTALSIEDVEGSESSDALEFPVTLTGDREAMTTVTVDYATSDGTGTAGSDYTEMSGTLTFATDVTRRTIRVPLLDDAVDEPDETFVVTLSNSSGAMLDDSEATGTIRDNDATSAGIALTATPARVLEDAGATVVAVTATLDAGARTGATEVTVSVSGSGNADAVDFADVADFTITIAAGDTSGSGNFTLTPEDDNVDESDETLNVDGSSVLPVTADTVALADDDQPSAAILLSASPGRISEDGGARRLRVRATLDASARAVATTVSVSVSGSGRPDAVGYAASATAFDITIAAGATAGTGTFTVTPEDDEVDERDEVLDIAGTSNLPVTPTSVTLTDDERTSTEILLSAVPSTVSEGAGATPVEVTATLDAGARTVSTTVAVTVSGSGNADAVDFADVADFTITIPAGDTSGSGTFTLTPEDDNVDESDETLNVDGSSVLPVAADTVALADDDQPSAAILLSASPGRISEDGGARRLRVRATLDSSARAVATTVSVSVSGSGRPDAVGYAASATAFDITIAAGATAGTGTFTVTPEDDEVDERDEVLDIAGTSNLPVTPTSVTLTDDEQTSTEILLSAVPSTVSEGAGATPVEVTATLDAGARTVSTTVAVTVSGSGNADAVDFADVRDFTITIPAGDTSGSGTFTLTPEDDNVDESDETLNVDGSSVLPVTADTVALADDDQPSAAILLSASPGRISEDGGARRLRVRATLDASARAVATTVSVSVSGSGRPDAVGYAASATAFDITIAAGATAGTGTFTVTPEDDEVDERDEVLDIAGTSNLPVTPTSVTLTDDERTSTEILLSAVPSTVSKGAGATPVEVTATLDAGARTVSTTVAVRVSGSGNADAVDFADVRDFTITIAAGATSGRATFTLTPEDDNVAESSETVTVDGRSDIPVTQTSVTLTDDDVASSGIVLSASPSLVSEDGGAVGVKVTASLNGAARQAATTVSVSVVGSGNPRAVDFQAVEDFSITIAANAASGTGTFTLTPVDDGAAEADETLTVSGASDLPVTPATVTLADDDDPSTRILLSAVPGLVSEGDGPTPVTVTATLDRALRQQATAVTVTVSGSGDAGAADFAAVADFSITIPANAASGAGTFTLTPRDDATAEADETLTVFGRVRPAGHAGDGHAGRRRRSVDADPAVGGSGARIGRRRPDLGDGDGDPGPRAAATGDRGDGDGVGQRRCGRGGLRSGCRLLDHHSRERGERRGDVHADAPGRRDGGGGRDADGIGRVRPAGHAGDGHAGRRRRSVDADPVVGGSGARIGRRRPDLGDGDGDPGPRAAATGDHGDGGGVGQRRRGRGGLRSGCRLLDHHSRERGERRGDVHADAPGRRDGGGERATNGIGRVRPAGHAGDGHAGRRRRSVDADPAVGGAGAGIGRRRRNPGNGDRDPGPRAAATGDRGDGDGVGQRRCGRGGLRGGCRLRDHYSRERGERRGDIHADARGRRDGGGGRDADGFGRVRPAGHAGDGHAGRRRRSVDADPVVGGAGARIGRRRADPGDGDRDPGPRAAATGDRGDGDGVGQRRRGRGGLRGGCRLRDHHSRERGERRGDVHADAGGRRDGGVGRDADGVGRVRPAGDAGGGDARGRRRGVDAHPAVPDGRSAPGVGRRRRDTRDSDGGGGQGRAPGRVADPRGGVGQRRSERGGLRRGDGLRDRDPGERPEWVGDVYRGAGRRPDRRGGRVADNIRRLRSAGEPGDLGTAGRRRGVHAHPAVGRSGAGVRGRRPGGGDGDGGPRPGSAPVGDDGDRFGVGQRRSERGGLRRGDGLRDRDPGERPEWVGDVHGGAGRRPDRRGGRGADSVRRRRSAGEPGDIGTAGRRRGVHAHPAVGRSGAGVGERRPGGGDGDRDSGPGSAAGGDDRDRVGDGRRRSARGGLRRGGGLRGRDSGERPEWVGDVHGGAGRRPDRRDGRGADSVRRRRSAGEAGDHGTAGRRRGVRAHPAGGRSGAGVRGRRPGGGDGDRDSGPGSAPGGDDRDRVGDGRRRSACGGLRRGGGLRDHHRGERPERHRDVHADAGGRRRGRGGRDAGVDG